MISLAIIVGLALAALVISVVVSLTDPTVPDGPRRRASRHTSG